MVKPIAPDDAFDKAEQMRIAAIPEKVVEVFNTLIVENMRHGVARVTQNDAISRIIDAMGVERQIVFDKNWLDIEALYRAAGWKVNYDKPAYYENYDAFFEFRR